MANKRRLQKEKRAKRIKELKDFYYAANNIESAAFEPSCEDEDDKQL